MFLHTVSKTRCKLCRFRSYYTHPGLGAEVPSTSYRWRPLERYVAVYGVDDASRRVTLLRLFNMSADWRSRILGE